MTHHDVPHEPPVPESETPGVPGLRSWRAVYLVVFGVFVLCVILLAAFTRVFQ